MTTPDSELARSLEAQTKGKVCRISGKAAIIIWWQDSYVATCIDHRPKPCLFRTQKPIEERLWNMTERAIITQPAQTTLTVKEIQSLICPLASPVEAEIFIRFCVGNGLNPLINDAYLIKYDQRSKAAIVIGIQSLLKRAAMNPNYNGYQSGVVVTRNGGVLEQEGSLLLKGDELIGAWCRISRSDWPQPLKVTVSLTEYHRHQAQWNERPATMIEKVALAQALRRAFPGEIGRIYDSARLTKMEVETGDVEDMPPPALTPPVETPAQPVQAVPTPQITREAASRVIYDGFAALGITTLPEQLKWIQSHCMVPDARRDWKPEHYQAVATALNVAVYQQANQASKQEEPTS